ncbi:cache domain-containing protein [Geomonas sp.]|uniref:cache domain-containing protein n=1 Tax=Geomonas sp. TaxID=2651584 RepID=UPI002B49374E|nr:cache domain-containing protein [Geomonas sp.]HJV36083.1 cache domain-containing protein [Geomonas sp.]
MPRRFPIRAKLTFGALIPVFAVIFLVSLTGLWIVNEKIASQAQEKVRTDLNSAREVYGNELRQMADLVEYAASTPIAGTAIATGNRSTIGALLDPLQRKVKLDLLAAVDRDGHSLYRAHDPGAAGAAPLFSSVQRALKGETVSGTEVVSAAALIAEGGNLAERAAVTITATPRAHPHQEPVERSGMVLISAAPIRDDHGRVIGAIYGGKLLNNDNTLVDRIKDLVYEGIRFEKQDLGTATLFLGGTRIATNVKDGAGNRAIGTRMSEEVYRRVILEKKKWVGRAFVVNDWCLTAYEPIFDVDGKAIGSLYVGMLEKPYTALRHQAVAVFAIILAVGSFLGMLVSSYIAGRLAKPIRELARFARRVAVGERDLRVNINSTDEVGELAAEFNVMTAALSEREREVQTLNRSLEQKVRERTAQLEEKNRLLLTAHEELARAEKLADLGVVAAGVAHEMNNPLAIMRGNTEVLEMYLAEGDEGREEVEVISRQIDRMAKIVANLLTFARQRPIRVQEVAIPQLLDDILEQAGHQVDLERIKVARSYAIDLPTIAGDPDKLRQVFINLIVNAVQAMPNGGVLTLMARIKEGGRSCEISVADTGPGIPPEHLDKLFTPFFTTKDQGTGLGLSVSYGIVKDHQGVIKPESRPGEGAVFRVVLPIRQEQHAARFG